MIRRFNPTRGLAIAAEYRGIDDSLGADRDWERAELGVGMALPLRRDVLWLTLAGGTDFGSDLPADRKFALGGPGSFPGLELGELRVGSYWTASTGYLWRIKDIMTIRNQALYAGLRVMAGSIHDRVDDVEGEDLYGGSVYLDWPNPGRSADRRSRRHDDGFVEPVGGNRPADWTRRTILEKGISDSFNRIGGNPMFAWKRSLSWPLPILLAATLGQAAMAVEPWWPPITDPPTAERQPGRWVWAELLTRDVGRAGRSSTGRCSDGRTRPSAPDDLKTYTLVSSGGEPIAAWSSRKATTSRRAVTRAGSA